MECGKTYKSCNGPELLRMRTVRCDHLSNEPKNSEADVDKESTKDDKCKAAITEVLEHEEGGDRAQFSHFRNADNDVETCEDLSDSDIVGSISARLPSANAPRTTMMTTQTLSWTMRPSVAEAARALDVMQLFVEKKGLMDKLAFRLDGFEDPGVVRGHQSNKRKCWISGSLFPQNKSMLGFLMKRA